jgi:hypothetical protein
MSFTAIAVTQRTAPTDSARTATVFAPPRMDVDVHSTVRAAMTSRSCLSNGCASNSLAVGALHIAQSAYEMVSVSECVCAWCGRVCVSEHRVRARVCLCLCLCVCVFLCV